VVEGLPKSVKLDGSTLQGKRTLTMYLSQNMHTRKIKSQPNLSASSILGTRDAKSSSFKYLLLFTSPNDSLIIPLSPIQSSSSREVGLERGSMMVPLMSTSSVH
jgi:hypothetical protein